MILYELLPELVQQIAGDLRPLGRADLAAEVMHLRAVDRCRCGLAACGATVTVANRRIIRIETPDPKVEQALRRAIP